ncbi:hypothetical protein [Longitalea arenae]|uniref:hypothetical protein n=1 Tax=Longitalea arenae TaxID=2812558 RepID=UPI0019671A53|nr:hypothetical protein [Longitalea arenae]
MRHREGKEAKGKWQKGKEAKGKWQKGKEAKRHREGKEAPAPGNWHPATGNR